MRILCVIFLLHVACGPAKRSTTGQPAAASIRVNGVVSSARGPEGGAVVFLLAPEFANSVVGFALADDKGRFVFEVSAGSYVVSASSPRGTSMVSVNAPGEIALVLDTDCVLVETNFEGQADSVTSYVVMQYEREDVSPPERYGAKAAKGEDARVCLPVGPYLMTMPDDEFVSAVRTLRVESPMSVSVPLFKTVEVQRPPDPPLDVANLDRETFLQGFSHAQVIALSEGNHGTREFFEEREKMILEMGDAGVLRVVMIEAGFGEVLAVNDYVQGRRDDVHAVVAGLGYWMWDTHEFIDFVNKLRTFNASRTGVERILLLGFDVQSSPLAVELAAGAKGLEQADRKLVLGLRDDDKTALGTLGAGEREALDKILSRVSALADKATVDSSDFNAGLAARALLHRIQALDADWPVLRRQSRDLGMAKMVEAVVAKVDGRKVALLGHSAHLSKTAAEWSDLTMGVELARTLGDRYAAIGFLAGAGTVRAWDPELAVGVIANEAPPPEPYMVEAVLLSDTAAVGAPTYVDLANASEPLRQWLSIPRYVREFGAMYPGTAEWGIRLRSILQAYDGMVVFAAGTATAPTATGERSAKDRKK